MFKRGWGAIFAFREGVNQIQYFKIIKFKCFSYHIEKTSVSSSCDGNQMAQTDGATLVYHYIPLFKNF